MTAAQPICTITSEFEMVEDYARRELPNNGKQIQNSALRHIQGSNNPSTKRPSSISAKALPKAEELKASIQKPEFIDLSASLASLREKEWSPEDTAEALLKDERVQERFGSKEELVSILSSLKKLDDDLHKIGCSSLHQFLSDLIPNNDIAMDGTDDINSGWVDVSEEMADTQEAQTSYAWWLLKGGYRCCKKLSEVKGVVSSLITVYVLMRDPRVAIVVKGLKWLVLGLL